MTNMTDRPDDADRGTTELILGALAGSTLLPFVQEVAKKAGEDVYRLLRDRLSRLSRTKAKAEIAETGAVTLADHKSRVLLQLPERIAPPLAGQLEYVNLPVNRPGWVLVTWDAAQDRWVVEDLPQPPTNPTTLDPQ